MTSSPPINATQDCPAKFPFHIRDTCVDVAETSWTENEATFAWLVDKKTRSPFPAHPAPQMVHLIRPR